MFFLKKKNIIRKSNNAINYYKIDMKGIYILSTDFGKFLSAITISGGSLIFQYTDNFYDALQMDKSKSDYYCSIKNFFKPLLLVR